MHRDIVGRVRLVQIETLRDVMVGVRDESTTVVCVLQDNAYVIT